MRPNKISPILVALLIGTAVSMVGCSTGDEITSKMRASNKENIRRVRNCYTMYQEAHRWQGPRDKDELMEYLTTDNLAAVKLERIGISEQQLETMWVSERDDQEFKIRWGLNGMRDHAVVFEAEGLEGKRLVCFAHPQELEEDEYESYLTGKKVGEAPQEMTEILEDEANAQQANQEDS